MAKVTSKLQLTVPKIIADEYGIRPGDNVDLIPAGESVRLVPSRSRSRQPKLRSVEERLEIFREMVGRQRERERQGEPPKTREPTGERPWKPHEIKRGWRREDLYTRVRPR